MQILLEMYFINVNRAYLVAPITYLVTVYYKICDSYLLPLVVPHYAFEDFLILIQEWKLGQFQYIFSIYQVNALKRNAAINNFPFHWLAKSVWYLKIWSRDLGVPESTSKIKIQSPRET